ncbi:hypothetical protein TD95_000219 [Thielaviopsis punctulata]|uniref:Initiator tRNA phosphoribosyl transferase n=1 Tax=Thielaviopsis punctulata TaxID=72032 RepID=A0A0F4ZDU6_9PEZI|nr:hypothetical protein TD95_000219 [Thielaviopsis punctulata]
MTSPATAGIKFSDLVLPQQESLSHLLSDLKKSSVSITNRLRSIVHDAAFVEQVAAAYAPRKLIANERCGSWYVDVQRKGGSAYFKSTDGHTDAWKMSTRRLNVHLLKTIEEDDGCIIVDSTRRGKKMPDALSKTVPIWCAVLNALLFPNLPSSHILHTPPAVVSASEHAQITALLPSFVSSLALVSLDIPSLQRTLTKPLRPLWITPDTPLPSPSDTQTIFSSFRPVICCTASARSSAGELSAAGYVQGAADDTEMWAHGLTAPLFWAHRSTLLATPEHDLPALMARLAAAPRTREAAEYREIAPHICVAALPVAAQCAVADGRTCVISLTPDSAPVTKDDGGRWMARGIGKHKAASRNLRTALAEIGEFASAFVRSRESARVVVACESGKDISVGTALALSCLLYNDDASLRPADVQADFTKTSIRVRLGKIMVDCPDVNPSRNTLQSVNSYLMGN